MQGPARAPISVVYVALGLLLLVARWRELPHIVREGLLGQAAAGSDARAGEMARPGAGHLGRDVAPSRLRRREARVQLTGGRRGVIWADWRRATLDEAEAILARVGLTGPFWSLRPA